MRDGIGGRGVTCASNNTTASCVARSGMRISRDYAKAIYRDAGATLDDLREAVKVLEDTARIARRVLGGAHPLTTDIEGNLQDARATLRGSAPARRRRRKDSHAANA